MNKLFKLIKQYNLEDELEEIYPYNKEDYKIKVAIFRKFVDDIIEKEFFKSELVKLFYFYFQAVELTHFFLKESPSEVDGIVIIKNILIERISKWLIKIDSLDEVKTLLLKRNINLEELLKCEL